MNDEAGIRRANLNRIAKARKLGPTALSRAYEGSPTPPYWSELRRGKKDFGEKAARDIEAGLELPRGWLDQAGAPLPEPGAQAELPMAPPQSHSHFATLAAERIDEIPDEERREAAYSLLIQMLDFGAEVTHAPSGGQTQAAESRQPADAASARAASTPRHTQLPGR